MISALDEVLTLVLSAMQRRPAASLPRRLDALFRELQAKTSRRAPDDIEDLIWAIWIGHEDVRAASSMHAAIEAMQAGEPDLARPILDRLVADYPDWPEAWNKRALLALMEERDELSLGDIAQTLRLEPRHFGAISGFGQLCVRSNRFREARAAFQMALRVNPHLDGVPQVIAELGEAGESLH
ncbi:MAG: tetratricopeptide repeat protein [Methylobacteriaceae bacterium]|nr:tetratricopeptide repeat protein [Methylobacteriaceae bacterium]MBV9219754.1 tetratricopeptide repeat protein [Methylobacteriaceae bacterium]MBV9244889.1 tetratricopeptide repeat protein [Methylobacteriaceae bacterium]MBV9634648.1 tetratricopeptide repeat protein [Methylobacteriaceae bacterium]MBV9703429.1 tetratricopeptide repeat protein [Methylobacteriaceae bacterium]